MLGRTTYYVNVSQTIGIIGALILGWRALDIEAAKAGIQKRSLKQVIIEDVRRVSNWYSDNFGNTRQYPHF